MWIITYSGVLPIEAGIFATGIRAPHAGNPDWATNSSANGGVIPLTESRKRERAKTRNHATLPIMQLVQGNSLSVCRVFVLSGFRDKKGERVNGVGWRLRGHYGGAKPWPVGRRRIAGGHHLLEIVDGAT
jgi:hypothetical protein